MTSIGFMTGRIVFHVIVKWKTKSFGKNLPPFLGLCTFRRVTVSVKYLARNRSGSNRTQLGNGSRRTDTVNVTYRPVVKDRDLRHYDIDFDPERRMMIDAVHLQKKLRVS